MNSKYIIAIDPGCPATVTFTRGGKLVACASGQSTARLTLKKKGKRTSKKWSHCYPQISSLIHTYADYARGRCENVELIFEQVGAMPNQGLSSMSKLVSCVAYIRGVAHTLKKLGVIDSYRAVTPQVWKKKMREVYPDFNVKGGREHKHDSLLLARHVFRESPRAQRRLAYKKDHDFAEAMLIGHYAELVRE